MSERLEQARFEEEHGGICVEDQRKYAGSEDIAEFVFGFGEWLVDVELFGTGFREVLPTMKLEFAKGGEKIAISLWYPPQSSGWKFALALAANSAGPLEGRGVIKGFQTCPRRTIHAYIDRRKINNLRKQMT